MEGISIRWDREVILNSPGMRKDLFRPMKRAVTDLSLSGKRKEKTDLGDKARPTQAEKGNHVPVVSVQYDVPKVPTSPMLMFRYRKSHTQVALREPNQRAKSETKLGKI